MRGWAGERDMELARSKHGDAHLRNAVRALRPYNMMALKGALLRSQRVSNKYPGWLRPPSFCYSSWLWELR